MILLPIHDLSVHNSIFSSQIDIYTVKIEDLAWTADFLLRTNRNDYIQVYGNFDGLIVILIICRLLLPTSRLSSASVISVLVSLRVPTATILTGSRRCSISRYIAFFFSLFRAIGSYVQSLLVQDALTVKKGEEMKGTFKCLPNKRNERDLDFQIKACFFFSFSFVP